MSLADGADLTKLVERLGVGGLHVVSIDEDKHAIVAFRADDDLTDFQRAMDAYEAGPRTGAKSSQWDVLEYIDPASVRRWSRDDRIGPRLRAQADVVTFRDDELYKLDLELWHPGTVQGATEALTKIRRFVESRRDRGARVLDTYVGRTMCLVRVAARGAEVDALLEVPEVAELDLPPQCQLDASDLPANLAQPFPAPPRPPADGPRLCILDSGITSAHPLLAPFVGDASSFHSAVTAAADIHGHGTAVAGAAVFGDLRRRVATGDFESSVTVFSARMLDDNNELDGEKLVVN